MISRINHFTQKIMGTMSAIAYRYQATRHQATPVTTSLPLPAIKRLLSRLATASYQATPVATSLPLAIKRLLSRPYKELASTLFPVLFFCCFLTSFSSFGATETVTEVKKGSEIALGTSIFVSDQCYRYDQDSYNFRIFQQQAYVKLFYTDLERQFINVDWDLTVSYDLEIRFNDGSSVTHSDALSLDSDANEDGLLKDIDYKQYPGAAWAKLTITGVSYSGIPSLNNDFHLELTSSTERIYWMENNTSPSVVSSSYNSTLNTLDLSWSFLQGAESYDLEWVYVADGEASGTHSSSSTITYDFRNATRINLNDNQYAIPLAYSKGSIIYRVRGVGFDEANIENYPNNLAWSPWSYEPTTFTLAQASSDNSHYYYYTGLDDQKNWTYTAVYAEEGKRKEVATYFDGSGRNRQQVTVQNTDDFAVIGETYYDFVGRGAVNVLPTPVSNQGIRFYGDATNPFNGTFNANNFATDDHLDEDIANVIPEPLPSTSATSEYYSTNNPLDFVNKDALPLEPNYPYTFTQFTNDGTERPKVQTGIGEDLKWQSTSGHAARFYYEKARQSEIDRLFGNEAGYERYYQKVISIDPNQQQSVQYLDAKGRVIATALAGDNPSALDTIKNKEVVSISTPVFQGSKIPYNGQVKEFTSFTATDPSSVTLTYDLLSLEFESCYQSSSNEPETGWNDIKFNVELNLENELGSTIANEVFNATRIDNNNSLNWTASYQQYKISRSIEIDSTDKATFLAREDSLLENVYKFNASSCAPHWWISPDTICDTVNCDSSCYRAYTYTLDDTLFYTDDLGNTYRPISSGSSTYEWVEDPSNPKANWGVNSASAPWNLEIDSCLIACEEYKDTTGAGDIRQFYAEGDCDIKYNMLLTDMSPGGQYLSNSPGQYIYNNDGTVTPISCDSWYCFNAATGLTDGMYDSLEFTLNGVYYKYYDILVENGQFCILDDLAYAASSTTQLFSIVLEGTTYTANDVLNSQTANYICYPQTPSSTSPTLLESGCLSSFNTNTGNSFASWDDLKANWDDSFAAELVSCHPEYCAHQFFCNYSFSCNGTTYTMDDLKAYLGEMHGAFTYTKGINHTVDGTAYNYMNPLGLTNNNSSGISGQNKDYITETVRALDPLFACSSGASTELSAFAYDSLSAWLTEFIPVVNTAGVATGNHYSLWYLLDDPDGIADANGGNSTDLHSTIVELFNSFHGDGNCLTGVITSDDDKYTFFTAIYTAYREKVLYDWFKQYYTCDDGNLYTYWDGDADFDGVLDANNYNLIYPKNPLYEVITYGPDSDFAEKIIDQTAGVQDNYAVSSIDSCSHDKFTAWVATLGTGLTNAQITDSLNANFCFSYTVGIVDTFINADLYNAYNYMPLLPDSLKCKLSLAFAISQAADCSATLAKIARQEADERWELEKEAYLDSLSAAYDKYAWDKLDSIESASLSYSLGEYHYTLYYYDQAGNLVKTIPPQGAKPLDQTNIDLTQDFRNDPSHPDLDFIRPTHEYVTLYTYNTQNQLIEQTTPDGGTTQFWYDNAARLVASQNARQLPLNQYSYSIYDGLSRIVESGQINGTTNPMTDDIARDPAQLLTWLSSAARSEVTFTLYDRALSDLSGSGTAEQAIETHFGADGQRYLRNRVASTMYVEDIIASAPYIFNNTKLTNIPSDYLAYENASHYSYDPHGNVESLIQDFPELDGAPHFRRFFKIDYDYDLVSGNVNQVSFQEGYNDAFYHRYLYDADNRIRQVETSKDQIIWEKEARYYYYPHGPLSRTEIGDQHIQGMDYAYTIQGWLKAVNGTSLGGATPGQYDLGKDGVDNSGLNSLFASDAFGFALHYFDGDYDPFNSSSNFIAPASGDLTTHMNSRGLFNGNIPMMTTALMDNTQAQLEVTANTYTYDQLNRITSFKAFEDITATVNNTYTTPLYSNHQAEYEYDANGNLTDLRRWKDGGVQMDDFTYNYDDLASNSVENRNRLLSVNDLVADNIDANDVDNQSNSSNYAYDAIGNLIQDISEGIEQISWMVNGKVKSIDKAGADNDMAFTYDALGNRIKKTIDPTASVELNATWYVRDAQGNVMATYKQDDTNLTLTEQHIYGSDRLGLVNNDLITLNQSSFSASNLILEAWTTYRIMPNTGTPNMTISVTGDYTVTLKALQENISISSTGLTPLTGLYEDNTSTFDIPKGGAITFIASAGVTLSTAAPFDLTVSKDGFLQNGDYNYLTIGATASRTLGNKAYELKNHLGSVHTVISDRKLQVEDPNNTGTVAYYQPNVISHTDYYPFGMQIGHRSDMGSDHRYAFNGKEQDPAWNGNRNMYDFGARIHDPRIGRFLSLDPRIHDFPELSPYIFAANSPIQYIDENGEGPINPKTWNRKSTILMMWNEVVFLRYYEQSDGPFARDNSLWLYSGLMNMNGGSPLESLAESGNNRRRKPHNLKENYIIRRGHEDTDYGRREDAGGGKVTVKYVAERGNYDYKTIDKDEFKIFEVTDGIISKETTYRLNEDNEYVATQTITYDVEYVNDRSRSFYESLKDRTWTIELYDAEVSETIVNHETGEVTTNTYYHHNVSNDESVTIVPKTDEE